MKVLTNAGSVSAEVAKRLAEERYETFRVGRIVCLKAISIMRSSGLRKRPSGVKGDGE